MPLPYKVFTIYAREDAQYLEELRGQLRPLEKAGRIKVWSDREINPGVDWEREIIQNLDTADIILILVSAAYYNSVYIHEKEIKYALMRHDKGEARVLPIIVRPCSFGDDPDISRLQVLPTDGKPVTDRRSWPERDVAWLDVVAGVKRTLDLMQDAEKQAEQARLAAEQQKKLEAARKQEQERLAKQAEADAQARAAQEAKERAYQAEQAQQHKIQEENYRRADREAWEYASTLDEITACQTYLTRFPQGAMTREANNRIKMLKKQHATPLPWGRYAAYSGGLLVLFLVIWRIIYPGNAMQSQEKPLVESIAPSNKDTITSVVSKPVEKNDTTQQQPVQIPVEPKFAPSFTFNYPMERVQGGTFQMGSPSNEKDRDDDECQYSATVSSFYLGKYEVTQAQWKAIMGKNPSRFKGCDDCPVEQVSWNDVQTFIKKLNEKTAKTYRLPTELEWEFAARGGNNSQSYIYAGSNSLSGVAWYGDNADSKTHPVGKKTPNALGLYDMSGNVWEWCGDYYKAYPNCKGSVEDGRFRVIRGGGWGSYARDCRAANRDYGGAAHRGNDLGFRLVSVSLQLNEAPDGIH